MHLKVIQPQIQQDRDLPVPLMHQSEGRVVAGIEVNDEIGAIFQSDIHQQVRGKVYPPTELCVDIGGDADCCAEVDRHTPGHVEVDGIVPAAPGPAPFGCNHRVGVMALTNETSAGDYRSGIR